MLSLRTVDEIWSFEFVQHGDSALLNEGKLGNIGEPLSITVLDAITNN